MYPWVALALTGVALAGYGWLLPAAKKSEEMPGRALADEESYDRLLDELETENRELIDAVSAFKKEQDETVKRLGRRIRELETTMGEWKERASGAVAQATSAAAPSIGQVPSSATSTEGTPTAGLPTAAASTATRPVEAASSPTLDDAGADRANGRAEPPAVYGERPEERAEPMPDAPQTIRDRYAELLGHHERGRSVEQIAKALGMNKGEVQLILQLAKREEKDRA